MKCTPIIYSCIALIIGIIIGAVAPPLLFILMLITLGVFIYTVTALRKNDSLQSAAIMLLFILCGAMLFQIARDYPRRRSDWNIPEVSSAPVRVRILQPFVHSGYDRSYYCARILPDTYLPKGFAGGKLLLSFRNTLLHNVNLGDIIILKTKIMPLSQDKNTHAYWYTKMRLHRITGTCMLNTPNDFLLSARQNTAILHQVHQKMQNGLLYWLPPPYGALSTAILLGNHTSIPRGIEQEFLRAGSYHILVISGLHIILTAALIIVVLRRIGVGFKPSLIISTGFLFIYLLIVGARPAVTRAVIMTAAGIFSIFFERDRNVLNALALAAVILLIINPYALFDAGFQLSFIATVGIIVITPFLLRLFSKLPPIISEYLAIALAAQIGVVPLQLYYFSYVNPFNVFSVIAVMPLFSAAIFIGLIMCLLQFIMPFINFALSGFMLIVLICIRMIIRLFTALPIITVADMPPWIIAVLYGIIGVTVYVFYWREEIQQRKLVQTYYRFSPKDSA